MSATPQLNLRCAPLLTRHATGMDKRFAMMMLAVAVGACGEVEPGPMAWEGDSGQATEADAGACATVIFEGACVVFPTCETTPVCPSPLVLEECPAGAWAGAVCVDGTTQCVDYVEGGSSLSSPRCLPE